MTKETSLIPMRFCRIPSTTPTQSPIIPRPRWPPTKPQPLSPTSTSSTLSAQLRRPLSWDPPLKTEEPLISNTSQLWTAFSRVSGPRRSFKTWRKTTVSGEATSCPRDKLRRGPVARLRGRGTRSRSGRISITRVASAATKSEKLST